MFASLQLLRFLPFSPLLFPSVFLFLFYYRAHQCYPKLKLYTRTVGILVSLSTDFLRKLDGVYSHWNVYSCVSQWRSNRYYTINQGTEKRRDTNLKLLHILVKPLTLPVRNEQRCCSAAEWLQEALQKSCKSAGLQQPQILAAVESPLTAINSAFAAVQKIP